MRRAPAHKEVGEKRSTAAFVSYFFTEVRSRQKRSKYYGTITIYIGKENIVLKTTYDYILEWYELHYLEVIPQNLIDKIIRN